MRLAAILAFIILLPFLSMAEEQYIPLRDGLKLRFLIEYPAKTNSYPAPLAIVIGGGSTDKNAALGAMKDLGLPLVERGYIAVSPISTFERSFYNNEEVEWALLLIERLLKRKGVSNRKVLIGGMSNGGTSALSISIQRPSWFSGVIMAPGSVHTTYAKRDLKGLPVYLRIGAKDSLGWGKHYPQAVKTLEKANARLDAKLLPDAGHGIPFDWKELDAWIAQLSRTKDSSN